MIEVETIVEILRDIYSCRECGHKPVYRVIFTGTCFELCKSCKRDLARKLTKAGNKE